MKKNKSNKPNIMVIGFLLIMMLVVIFDAGLIGDVVGDLLYFLFGYLYFVYVIFFIVIGVVIFFEKSYQVFKGKFFQIGLEVVVLVMIVFSSVDFGLGLFDVGYILNFVYTVVSSLIGSFGFALVYVVVAFFLVEDVFLRFRGRSLIKSISNKVRLRKIVTAEKKKREVYKQEIDIRQHEVVIEPVEKIVSVNYQIPNLNLLSEIKNDAGNILKLQQQANEKSLKLIKALDDFKLKVKVDAITIGPSVTRYELLPEPGVKVAKFTTLSNDIALALAASAVRIEAPVFGKSVVGIEIPNESILMIGLKDVLSDSKNDFEKKLQVGLGKTIEGDSAFLEIDKTPHLLVAGSTGSGKSVCINSIIVSILLKASAEDVKMIMIDPKKVELTPYNGIGHLLTPVITDPKKASAVLNKMVEEMQYRYDLFAKTNTRNIETYNESLKSNPDLTFKRLAYIVIIIDELADLMMVASSEVETSIARLAQMARAAGMHLIIATQRPSTDVITGLIKANIPSRIAFAVSSSIDSRTILDSGGAEKLLGRGDMFLSLQGNNNLQRIQGAYLSDVEIQGVVSYIKDQTDGSNYDERLENLTLKVEVDGDLDDLYEEVYQDVISMQKASASFIQRKYKVGYNRALRIIDQLEQNGVIGPNEGPKPRKVLVSDDES